LILKTSHVYRWTAFLLRSYWKSILVQNQVYFRFSSNLDRSPDDNNLSSFLSKCYNKINCSWSKPCLLQMLHLNRNPHQIQNLMMCYWIELRKNLRLRGALQVQIDMKNENCSSDKKAPSFCQSSMLVLDMEFFVHYLEQSGLFDTLPLITFAMSILKHFTYF
jgi:hypothetical protein